MKFSIAIFVMLASLTAKADNLSTIVCRPHDEVKHASFSLFLDKDGFSPNSSLTGIARARWVFNFSTARMTCSDQYIDTAKKESLRCIGYNTAGGLNEVSLILENGQGTGKVTSFGEGSEHNPYKNEMEGLELSCRTTTQP